jgi:predicted ferric reductase
MGRTNQTTHSSKGLRMGMAEMQDAKEQSSSPLPPRRQPERKRHRSVVHPQPTFAGNLFTLDPNVGVAVNLALRPFFNDRSKQPYQQHTSRLPTVPERPSLLRCSSKGEMSSCVPPLRHMESGEANSTNTTIAIAETEQRSIYLDTNGDLCSFPVRKKSHTPYNEIVVEPNEPHPSLEFPPLYFILKKWPWLLQAIKYLYLFRWKLSYPFQRRVIGSRFLRKLGIYLTWGEILLIMPFFALVIVGTLWSFLYPSPSITGQVSRLPLIFCFATAMRNSFLSFLLGMPFSKALWYHKLAGRIAFINGIFHTYVCYFYPDDGISTKAPPSGKYTNVKFAPYLIYDTENISGTAILALVTGILIASIPYIRHKLFELFYYIHVVFAACMAGCSFYHSGKLVPILVTATWGFDLIMRKVIMAATRYPKKAQSRIISSSVVELRFPKTTGFDFNPGQYVYLCVPQLSILEWHPFSISSSPGQKIVTLHIRKAGSWSSALHDLAQTRDEISILLEGPYGNSDVDLASERYNTVLLLSGGIGITPMQSVCNQLIYEHSNGLRTLNKLCFVWIERDPMIMSDVEVVRRSSTMHLNTSGIDALSVTSRLDDGAPLGIASTILALVPPLATTNVELSKAYPNSCRHEEQSHDAFAVAAIRGDPDEMCAMSQLSDEASFMEHGCGITKNSKRWRDDDTFLGAAYNETTVRSPTDVLDMQIYLTSTDPSSGLSDLPFVYHGRPDIKRLFLKMREGALVSGESRVAVCVCAPSRIVDLCQEACVKFSDARFRFDFHSEEFN